MESGPVTRAAAPRKRLACFFAQGEFPRFFSRSLVLLRPLLCPRSPLGPPALSLAHPRRMVSAAVAPAGGTEEGQRLFAAPRPRNKGPRVFCAPGAGFRLPGEHISTERLPLIASPSLATLSDTPLLRGHFQEASRPRGKAGSSRRPGTRSRRPRVKRDSENRLEPKPTSAVVLQSRPFCLGEGGEDLGGGEARLTHDPQKPQLSRRKNVRTDRGWAQDGHAEATTAPNFPKQGVLCKLRARIHRGKLSSPSSQRHGRQT